MGVWLYASSMLERKQHLQVTQRADLKLQAYTKWELATEHPRIYCSVPQHRWLPVTTFKLKIA